MSAPPAISYEKQSHTDGIRGCGAACLSMVYRSLGQDVSQDTIWPLIAKTNRFGSLASTTHLMAQDALNRGFRAIAVQARHPLQTLRLCQEMETHAILNHRTRADASTGHYSVLVDVTERDAVLHDPFYGPSRRMSHSELLELWQPLSPNSEIAGYVLIAIAAGPAKPSARACEFCHTLSPISAQCPRCAKPVEMQPEGPLGCANTVCIARMWNYICCPFCDQTFTFNLDASSVGAGQPVPPGASSPSPQEARAADPLNFDSVFAELDKFSAHILSLPGMADRSDIAQHIDFLRQAKERLNLAKTEALAHQATSNRQMSTLEETVNQRKDAHAKRMEELNTQAPPLDGNALGRALLKGIGFLD